MSEVRSHRPTGTTSQPSRSPLTSPRKPLTRQTTPTGTPLLLQAETTQNSNSGWERPLSLSTPASPQRETIRVALRSVASSRLPSSGHGVEPQNSFDQPQPLLIPPRFNDKSNSGLDSSADSLNQVPFNNSSIVHPNALSASNEPSLSLGDNVPQFSNLYIQTPPEATFPQVNSPFIGAPYPAFSHQARPNFQYSRPDYSQYYPPNEVPYAYGYSARPEVPVFHSPVMSHATSGGIYGHSMETRNFSGPPVEPRSSGYYEMGPNQGSPVFFPKPPVLYPTAQSTTSTSSGASSHTNAAFHQNRPLPWSGVPTSQISEQKLAAPIFRGETGHRQRGSAPIWTSPEFNVVPRRARREPPKVLQSPVLSQFRARRDDNWELSDIFGHLSAFSSDQYGSRFVQDKLVIASAYEKDIVFDELVPSSALPLMSDVFGNYVVQKLFEFGNDFQRRTLANLMRGNILWMTLNMYACRVVQKALDFISLDQQSAFIEELNPHIIRCVKDANGNHVVQKLIQCVSPSLLTFLRTFRENILELASHPYGCRCLQRCLEHLPVEYSYQLSEAVLPYTADLVQDQFGNYVVQYVLEHGRPQDRSAIISRMSGSMLVLSRHKYASNCCEKALLCAHPSDRHNIINELLVGPQTERGVIAIMLRDQYANYVLQRVLTLADDEQKTKLSEVVRPLAETLRRNSSGYNKHLVAIEKILDSYPTSTTSA